MKPKLPFLLTLLLGILACGVSTAPAPSNDDPKEEPTATFTHTPTATATNTPTATPTFTPTPTPFVCTQPLTPEDGVELFYIGKVIFSWTPMDDAANYFLNILLPFGNIVVFESEETEIVRYMKAFRQGGEYQWYVTALNAEGKLICSSHFFTFTKPALDDDCSPDEIWNGLYCETIIVP